MKKMVMAAAAVVMGAAMLLSGCASTDGAAGAPQAAAPQEYTFDDVEGEVLFETTCTMYKTRANKPVDLYMVAEFGSFNVTTSDGKYNQAALTGVEWWNSANGRTDTVQLAPGDEYVFEFSVSETGADCLVEVQAGGLYFSTTSQCTAWCPEGIALGVLDNGGAQILDNLKAGNVYAATVRHTGSSIVIIYTEE